MAIKIKGVDRIAEKWSTVTPQRATEFQRAIQETSPDEYARAATAAGPSYAAGVTEAIGKKRYEKGVAGAGAKWQRKAVETGAARYGPGVQAAAGDYATAFAPYQAVIAGTTLPPRGPTGAISNYARVQAIGEALRKKKVAG